MRRKALLLFLAAVAFAAAGCQTAVLHGLSEQDTNQVIAALQDQGIMASKELDNAEAGTWKVVVPRKDASRVWSVLQGYRLPSTRGRRVQDVFGKSKLLTGSLEEKALFLEAFQGVIAHTLDSVSGVVSARVHVAIPEPDLSGQAQHAVKASVMIEFPPDPSGRPPRRSDRVARSPTLSRAAHRRSATAAPTGPPSPRSWRRSASISALKIVEPRKEWDWDWQLLIPLLPSMPDS